MNKHAIKEIAWQEVDWQRPFEAEAVWDTLIHLASMHPRGALVWEVRGSSGKVRYLIGAEKSYIHKIESAFQAHGDVRFSDIHQMPRKEITHAAQLRTSKKLPSLNTDTSMAVLRADRKSVV